jgi:hypothetical protein
MGRERQWGKFPVSPVETGNFAICLLQSAFFHENC